MSFRRIKQYFTVKLVLCEMDFGGEKRVGFKSGRMEWVSELRFLGLGDSC